MDFLVVVVSWLQMMAAVVLQTLDASDLIPSTWAFADLTAAIGAIAGMDIVKYPFIGLLALSLLITVATRLKRTVKAGK